MSRSLQAFILAIMLIVLLWLGFARPVYTGVRCMDTYIVQRGDILSRIAERFNVPLRRLILINRIHNPNFLYVGQSLCLHEANIAPQTPSVSTVSTLTLETTFSITTDLTETAFILPQKRKIGRRAEFPIPGVAPLEIITSAQPLLARIAITPAPVFWVANMQTRIGEPKRLVLITTQPQTVLSSLFLSTEAPISSTTLFTNGCPLERISQEVSPTLFDPRLRELTLWFEAADGMRYPFAIEGVSVADLSMLKMRCFSISPQLALLPADPAHHQERHVLWSILLTDDPGPGSGYFRCRALRRSGILSRVLASLTGCR